MSRSIRIDWRTLPLAAAVALLLVLSPAVQARTIKWSGYTWSVRTGTGGPGADNVWSDGNATVKDGNLLLNIVPRGTAWTSVELTSSRTVGFGRYRWVINSDVSKASPASVLGLFTYSPQMTPSFGEQDFEFTGAWSAPATSWTGWFVSWRAPTSRAFANFDLPSAPPYAATITWLRGFIAFRLTDRYSRVIFSRTVRTTLAPKALRVHINYWISDQATIAAPGAAPQMSLRSFTYTPAKIGHLDRSVPSRAALTP
jgi:hypothetical protein